MPKSLPAWATKLIGAVLLVAAYLAHATGVIPATLEWHRVNILGALNELVLAAGMIGLSGPALWPKLAALLGNPSAGVVNDAARAVGAPIPTAKGTP